MRRRAFCVTRFPANCRGPSWLDTRRERKMLGIIHRRKLLPLVYEAVDCEKRVSICKKKQLNCRARRTVDCRTGGRLAFASSRHVVVLMVLAQIVVLAVVMGVAVLASVRRKLLLHYCGVVYAAMPSVIGVAGHRTTMRLLAGRSLSIRAILGMVSIGFGRRSSSFPRWVFCVCAALAVTGSLAVHGADVCAGGQGCLLVGGFAGSLGSGGLGRRF